MKFRYKSGAYFPTWKHIKASMLSDYTKPPLLKSIYVYMKYRSTSILSDYVIDKLAALTFRETLAAFLTKKS